ncbi:MAG: VWA domain-containing protein [Saprospirales bacterium]|nr:VWA domain-containing protein [Saprospirales bacterium]
MKTKIWGLLILFGLLAIGCSKELSYPGFDSYNYAGGDRFNDFEENPFIKVIDQPVSTFSIDADGASYAYVRRQLQEDFIPPAAAVRTEELINYFPLNYDQPTGDAPISVNGEVGECPWAQGHQLVRIGLQGKTISDLPPSNIVLLIDVSGSMSSPDKLELLKDGFEILVDQFDAQDRIAIVTYAGSAGVVLESTPGDEKTKIKKAINKLGSGGSTAGAEGIITAYEIAQENFIPGGNNRVIIGTDGDFNVGPSSQEELVALIKEKRELDIFITVLGVGSGNLNDGMLEQIADNGNGTYEYIDHLEQAKKVFVYEFGKLYTVAKDVKVQVVFNPDMVSEYRLIGYENRLLTEEEFEADSTDAGEIGAGQNITALYEIIPANSGLDNVPTFTIDFKYKHPDSDISIPLQLDIFDEGHTWGQASEHLRFTASVAAFGLLLRNSDYKGTATYDQILDWSYGSMTYDPHGFRSEFLELVQKAKSL